MHYSRTEWLFLVLTFGLSIGVNLSGDPQAALPVASLLLQLLLLLLLAFALIRYVALSVVIAICILLVGSGVSRLLGEHFGVAETAVLVIVGLTVLLSFGRQLLVAGDQRRSIDGDNITQHNQTIFRAVHQGNLPWTHRLLGMGADVNVRDENGRTPLMCAAAKGYADMVQVLIQNGADPKLKNNTGESAMSMAIMKGYTRIAKALEIAETAMGQRRQGRHR